MNRRMSTWIVLLLLLPLPFEAQHIGVDTQVQRVERLSNGGTGAVPSAGNQVPLTLGSSTTSGWTSIPNTNTGFALGFNTTTHQFTTVATGGGGSGPEIQHNGVDVPLQTLLNFNDTTPAAPPGNQNVTFQTDSSGRLSGYLSSTASSAGIVSQVIPPIAGQYVIVYPSSGVITNEQNLLLPPSSINATSGQLNYTCPNTLCGPGTTTSLFSGFTLPGYIVPGNVTAVYGFTVSLATAFGPMVAPIINCTGGTLINQYGWSLRQNTTLLSGVNGTNIGSVTCGSAQGGSLFGDKRSQITISLVGLIVYYTGTPPPADTRVLVAPPLTYTSDTNTLSFDPSTLGYLYPHTIGGLFLSGLPPADQYAGSIYEINNGASSTDCTTGGGSSIVLCYSNGSAWTAFSSGGGGAWSALTNPSGNLALTMGANTSTFTYNAATGSSDLFKFTDTASNTGTGILGHFTTASGSTEIPWQADANGVGWKVGANGSFQGIGSSASNGMTIQGGTSLAPVASSAVITTDSSGNGYLSENGAAVSRICTPANGLCAGGGSATVASAEVVTFSATPTFSTSFNVSRIVLTGNITSFTLGAGADGQDKKLCFKQGAGPFTVAAPAGVHGFFGIGTTNAKWNCQTFVYDNTDSIWLSTGPGTIDE